MEAGTTGQKMPSTYKERPCLPHLRIGISMPRSVIAWKTLYGKKTLAKIYLHDVKGNPIPEGFNDKLGPGSSYAKQQAQRTTLTTINLFSDYTYQLAKHTFKVHGWFQLGSLQD